MTKDLASAGRLSVFSKSVIISLTHKVAYNLTRKKEKVQGKVVEVMGGQVIELDVIKAHREGIAEGKAEGIGIFIKDKLEDEIPVEIIRKKLEKNYNLNPEEAMAYIEKYSNVKTA